jgi:hypothetical protein
MVNQCGFGALGARQLRFFIMALDPEEFVILEDHGPMKLQSAVARAMMLPLQERDHASILRKGNPWVLNFELIKHLAARWDGNPFPLNDSELTAGAFSLMQVGR